MASFGGHTLPGTFFIIFALWNILRATFIQFTAGKRETSEKNFDFVELSDTGFFNRPRFFFTLLKAVRRVLRDWMGL